MIVPMMLRISHIILNLLNIMNETTVLFIIGIFEAIINIILCRVLFAIVVVVVFFYSSNTLFCTIYID